jgi:hypothetical protein
MNCPAASRGAVHFISDRFFDIQLNVMILALNIQTWIAVVG